MSRHAKKTDQLVTGYSHEEEMKDLQAHSEQVVFFSTPTHAKNPRGKVVITPEIAERFQKGIEQFYELRQGASLKEAYRRTLQHYFQVSYELHNGILVPILPPAKQFPTFRQFQYWYKQQNRSREAFISPEKDPLSGDPSPMRTCPMQSSFGPGALYQVDAVTCDIQVVSSLDPRRIIGQPTFYLLLDVFSQMIVGISMSWERPNWRGVMIALENAAEEKVSFCQHYGIAITEAAWPAHHLPKALLVEDPDKFESDSAGILDYLVVSLGIRIHIHKAFPFLHGWSTAMKQKSCPSATTFISSLLTFLAQSFQAGGTGSLTTRQVYRLMIFTALHYNLERSMDWYPLGDSMIADQVEPYPIHLWNWGIQCRSGHLRSMAPQMIRNMLLPQGEAHVTNQEILFQGLSYHCSLPLEELFLTNMGAGNQQRVLVIYNPQLVDVIYLQLDGGQQLVSCYLIEQEHHLARYAWQEFWDPFEPQQRGTMPLPSQEPSERARPEDSGETNGPADPAS